MCATCPERRPPPPRKPGMRRNGKGRDNIARMENQRPYNRVRPAQQTYSDEEIRQLYVASVPTWGIYGLSSAYVSWMGRLMKPYHWVLTGCAVLIVLGLGALLVYDVWAMLTGRPSLSVLSSDLHRLWVFLIGMFWGLVLGVCAGHLWPIEGKKV